MSTTLRMAVTGARKPAVLPAAKFAPPLLASAVIVPEAQSNPMAMCPGAADEHDEGYSRPQGGRS
jgi:hypothetical protein